MSTIKKVLLVVSAVVFLAMAATSANNSEQIVFSDTGATMSIIGNSNNFTSTPFGFWIWCAGAAAPGSRGGYQNANACQGSMYFYALQTKATHVVGHVTENPPNSGFYTMHVVEGTAAQLFSGTLNPTYTCTLANTTANPTNGPGNTVQVDCIFIAFGGGTGSDTDTAAVVNITGSN
jgi:hypothetical protein